MRIDFFLFSSCSKFVIFVLSVSTPDSEKTVEQQAEEERVLQDMLEVVDMRNSLVAFLDEKRLQETDTDEQQSTSLLEVKRHSTASVGAQVYWA